MPRHVSATPAAVAVAAALLTIAGCSSGGASGATSTVVVAAGDIACSPSDESFNDGKGTDDACRHDATSDLVLEIGPDAVLALGDTQYEHATLENYRASYEPTWGRFKDITYPVPGNHEYLVEDAKDYYEYFGERAGAPETGYYSLELGDWHLIALNSECDKVGGCQQGSAQETWLREDLAAHENACTLAYFHQPRFSSGKHGGTEDYNDLWAALYEAGAEIVLGGHDHHYERFAPLNPEGRVDTQRGIRQFVVGTGGEEHFPVEGEPDPISEAVDDTSFGVLELTLNAESYQWRFVPVPGDDEEFTDSGAASCH